MRVGSGLFLVVFFGGNLGGDTTINSAVGTSGGSAVLVTTGSTTLFVVVAAFVGDWVLPSVRGMAPGGDVVVGTLGHALEIFTTAGTIRGGAAMIDVIGTLGIGVGGVGGVGCVGGIYPLGWPGITRGSGDCGSIGRKLGGGAMSVAPSENIIASWCRARRELLLMGAR